MILNVKALCERFTKENCKKKKIKNQKDNRIKKVIKRKDNKLYVKWKCFDNHFNNWIDKKDVAIFPKVSEDIFRKRTSLFKFKPGMFCQ